MSKHRDAYDRRKGPDMPLYVTRQNVKDGVANDQENCTFGQCALSREHGMSFYINPDPENPDIYAEWAIGAGDRAEHHRADVRRRHPDGSETIQEAITIVAATDVAHKTLLRRFPKDGMEFVLTNHTIRSTRSGSSYADRYAQETEEERRARLDAKKERDLELKQARADGQAPPAARRRRPVRARFGG